MSYTALYRKLRPSAFKKVVGQHHITRTLTNQILSGRVSHAYLFCGTRGTGKTSTAKIFAKTINCLNPTDAEACGECEMCVSIGANRSTNVIEIDAASNSSVTDIRDLRETVNYPPAQGFYKVYIIDEIHMLSNSAFNALLKTLEEPPAHVVFILATTDPQKVPATIHSRCQRFDFKRIGKAEMADTLKRYMQEEGIRVTDEALSYVARVSDGAMRDALSILEQCVSYYFDEEITLDKILEIIGSVDDSVFYTLTDALYERKSVECMNIIDKLVMDGRDIGQFVSDLIEHFRNLLIVSTVQKTSNALDYSLENIELLKEQTGRLAQSFLIQSIEIFSELLQSLKYSVNERILLEIAVIKICSPVFNDSLDGVLDRLSILEGKIPMNIEDKPTAQPITEKKKKDTVKINKAVPDDIQNVIKDYGQIIKGFDARLQADLKNCFPGSLDDGLLYIVCRKMIYANYIKTRTEDIRNMLFEKTGKTFDIAIITEDDYNNKHNDLYGTKDENASMLDIESELKELDFPVRIE